MSFKALLLLLVFSLAPRCRARDPDALATTLAEHKAALADGTCRGLHKAYTDLHAKIIAGQAAQRYLVFVSPPSGIADRLTGLVAAFMVAVLTNRALLIAPHPMAYELLYDQPFVNWTLPGGMPGNPVVDPVLWPPQQRQCRNCAAGVEAVQGMNTRMNCPACEDDGHSVTYMNWINDNDARPWHMVTDLAAMMPDVHTVYYASNRGATVALFHNVHHSRQLYEMGLRPSTAFGCAYNYLFFPREETLAVVDQELKEVLAAEMVIGVQIRSNDNVLMGQELDESRLNGYHICFECALNLETALLNGRAAGELPLGTQGSGSPRVRWLLVADSVNMRQKAIDWYGNKTIVYMRSKPTHVSHSGADNMLGSRLAAAEHWMFGMTDYQVVHWWSGYGRTAAMRSMREASVITIEDDKYISQCGPGRLESAWQLGEGYSGVRRSRRRTGL